MKKIFSSIMMVAAVLFAASCTSEDLTQNESGENVKVSFSLGLEGISTRAISDGSGVNKLAYAVFDENGVRINGIEAKNEEVTFPATVELTLVKDKKYKVAFWAQNKACSAYSVDKEAMTVTVDYASIKENNDEKRDAFFKTVDVTVKGSTSIDVELKRALAQINVGVTAEDWNAAKKAGATIATSESFIKKAASSLNVLTGKTGNLVDVEYTAAAIPAEDLVVDGNTYKWLSMSYILVGDGSANGAEQTVLDDLGFKFNYEGGAVEFKSGLKSVPVMRNCRTNIVGTLLTGKANFNITVDNVFADNKNYPNTVAQQLELAAAVGGTVTLTEDVTLEKPLTVNSDMVINLNGKTLSYTSDVAAHSAMITVNSGKKLVVDDAVGTGKVSYAYTGAGDPAFGWGTYTIANNGELVLENGTVEMLCNINTATDANHMYCAIQQGGNAQSSTTINNGKVSNPTYRSIRINQGSLTVNNGTMEGQVWMHPFADNTSIEINGGSFAPRGVDKSSVYVENGTKTVNLKVTAGTFETKIGSADVTKTGVKGSVAGGVFGSEPNSNLIADGYKSVKNGDKYYVVADGVDAVVKTQEELSNALKNGNANIILFKGEYELSSSLGFAADNITISGEDKDNCIVKLASQLRAKDNITSLTLKNLTTDVPTGLGYTEHTFAWIHYLKNFSMIDCKSNGRIRLNVHNAVIDNCEFNVTTNSGFDGYAIFYYGPTNSNVKVSNSSFNTVGKAIVLYNEGNPVLNLDVDNCTFISTDPSTDKAAIQMHTECGISGTVDITNSTATGFANINNGLWNELNNNTKVPTDNFDITVDGVNVH